MFTKTAEFYDAIYSFKDYASEAERIHATVHEYKPNGANVLLDVACGTGLHAAELLARYPGEYTITGLDLDPAMLAIAAERCPTSTFVEGDMQTFRLDTQFDVITCLFSSIGYVKTLSGLNATAQNFANHVKPGGLLIVEPWLTPDMAYEKIVSARFADKAGLKIARMNVSKTEDHPENRFSVLNFHYLVATPEGVSNFEERHELGLFTNEHYEAAFRAAGLEVHYDEKGLMNRGLFICIKPI